MDEERKVARLYDRPDRGEFFDLYADRYQWILRSEEEGGFLRYYARLDVALLDLWQELVRRRAPKSKAIDVLNLTRLSKAAAFEVKRAAARLEERLGPLPLPSPPEPPAAPAPPAPPPPKAPAPPPAKPVARPPAGRQLELIPLAPLSPPPKEKPAPRPLERGRQSQARRPEKPRPTPKGRPTPPAPATRRPAPPPARPKARVRPPAPKKAPPPSPPAAPRRGRPRR